MPPGQKEIPPHLTDKSELGTNKSRLRMDGGGGIKESGRERKEAFFFFFTQWVLDPVTFH